MNLINNIVPIEQLTEHQIVFTYLVETGKHIRHAWVGVSIWVSVSGSCRVEVGVFN